MAVAVIADAHLGGPGGAPEPLIRQIEALPDEGCHRLVLLGDLFHVWVADPAFETSEVASVLRAVDGVRQEGLAVDYVEGNRDFFVQGGPYESRFDRVGLELDLAVGERRFLAVHGDGLNDRDRLYRFWRWLSKSGPSRAGMTHLPKRVARWLVQSTESGLARTNFKHKSTIPEAVVRRYGERRLAEGFDVMILGHFHEPRRWSVPGGEIRLLDAWFRSRRVEWLR